MEDLLTHTSRAERNRQIALARVWATQELVEGIGSFLKPFAERGILRRVCKHFCRSLAPFVPPCRFGGAGLSFVGTGDETLMIRVGGEHFRSVLGIINSLHDYKYCSTTKSWRIPLILVERFCLRLKQIEPQAVPPVLEKCVHCMAVERRMCLHRWRIATIEALRIVLQHRADGLSLEVLTLLMHDASQLGLPADSILMSRARELENELKLAEDHSRVSSAPRVDAPPLPKH